MFVSTKTLWTGSLQTMDHLHSSPSPSARERLHMCTMNPRAPPYCFASGVEVKAHTIKRCPWTHFLVAAELYSEEKQHPLYSTQSPTLRERLCLPQSPNPAPPRAYASVHHTPFSPCFFCCFFSLSGILVTFSKCQILALRHYACAHTSPPPRIHTNIHTHTNREQIHTFLA